MSCERACPVCLRLRRAAVQAVAEQGADGLSIPGLASHAGIPAAEIVGHYRTPAECLWATCDELARTLFAEMEGAFDGAADWQAGSERARRGLLERMAAHPGEARLAFVDAVRGDRALRHRRELARRRTVDYLLGAHRRLHADQPPPSVLQLELLVGATFHAIACEVGAGHTAELAQLEPRLRRAADYLIPASVERPEGHRIAHGCVCD